MKSTKLKGTAAVSPGCTAVHPGLTQAMLAEYAKLCELERLKRDRRLAIIALLEAGAKVERGPLTARLDVQTHVTCTWAKLTALVGEGQAAAFRSMIAPTASQRLTVGPRPRTGRPA